ncbi:MAG: response regulator [Bryobacteraceae bacterium]
MSEALAPFHVMIVEDNPADVYLVERALQENCVAYTLSVLTDGDEALRWIYHASDHPPELIVLDLHMPRTGGAEVLRAIRSAPRLADVPVMILSSSQSPSDKNRVQILGFARYVQKPTMLEEFLSQVGGTMKELLTESRARKATP